MHISLKIPTSYNWNCLYKKSISRQPLEPKDMLFLFNLLLSIIFFLYTLIFIYSKLIVNQATHLLCIATLVSLSLAAMYTSLNNKFFTSGFITTYLIPLNILALSFCDPLLNYSKIILLYGLVFVFVYKSKTQLVAALIYLCIICTIIQYRYGIAVVDLKDTNSVTVELILKGLFDVFAMIILLRMRSEFKMSKEKVVAKRKILEQKNKHLVELIDKDAIQTEQLKKAVLLKEKLITVLTHDIRVPLASLKFVIDNYKKGYIDKDFAIEGILQTGKDLENIDMLVKDIASWSKDDKATIGQMSLFEANEVIDSVISLYALSAKNKNITLINEGFDPAAKDLYINISQRDLAIIARNLISNALKFSHQDSQINIAFDPQASVADSVVSFFVKDFGVGMTEKKLENFKNTRNNFTRGTMDELGLGIGLSLVLDVIAKNNLQYEIESKLDVGTQFSIMIPVTSSKNRKK